jgi:hypothetical protein
MERAGRSYAYIALVSLAAGLLTLVGTGLFRLLASGSFQPAWFWVGSATLCTALGVFVAGRPRTTG